MQHVYDLLSNSRSKSVSNLFPMPLTPSRRLIENLLNKKNDTTNDSTNFRDASTSSTLTVEINPVDNMPSSSSSSEEVGTYLGEVLNLLTGSAFQLLKLEMEQRMSDHSEQRSMPRQIIEYVASSNFIEFFWCKLQVSFCI